MYAVGPFFAGSLLAVAVLAACGGSTAAPPASLSANASTKAPALDCRTLVDAKHPKENWLNGIDDRGEVAGYYGRFASGSSMGYVAVPPYGRRDYHYGELRGSVYTAILRSTIAGYLRKGARAVIGFVATDGIWTEFESPHGSVIEVLGVTDSGLALGFYSQKGTKHGFELTVSTGEFRSFSLPGTRDAVPVGANAKGDVVGYATASSGAVEGFLVRHGNVTFFSYPGSASTTGYGVDRRDRIVGSYRDAAGATHGFVLSDPTSAPRWESFDDSDGAGFTVLRGSSDRGAIVGDYRDAHHHTHGILCNGG